MSTSLAKKYNDEFYSINYRMVLYINTEVEASRIPVFMMPSEISVFNINM